MRLLLQIYLRFRTDYFVMRRINWNVHKLSAVCAIFCVLVFLYSRCECICVCMGARMVATFPASKKAGQKPWATVSQSSKSINIYHFASNPNNSRRNCGTWFFPMRFSFCTINTKTETNSSWRHHNRNYVCACRQKKAQAINRYSRTPGPLAEIVTIFPNALASIHLFAMNLILFIFKFMSIRFKVEQKNNKNIVWSRCWFGMVC